MKTTMVLKHGATLWLLATMLLATVAGCAAPAPTPPPPPTPPAKEEGKIQQVIEVKADGLTLHYLSQSFWGEKEFSSYLASQAQFKANFKGDFEQGLAQSDSPVSASNYSFSFDRTTCSTVTGCDVHGAISKSQNKYRATFFWLLKPLGLDFIDDNFEESTNGLSWEGLVKSVPTTITVELPVIDGSVYKAWEQPIGHCHAHAWWSD